MPDTLIHLFLDTVAHRPRPDLFLRRVQGRWESIAAERALADVESAEARRIAAEAAHDALLAARQDAAEDANRWSARAEALHLALEGARARAGAAHLSGLDGVLGTLLDLIEIDDGWQEAVEAALGEALQAVVVADRASGRRAIESLQANNVNGAVLALGAGTGEMRAAPGGGARG